MLIEVIVPVYNAPEALRACLRSLQRTLSPDHPIQVVDDSSTEPAVAAILEEFAKRPGVVLRQNQRNLGFVRTVNDAMSASDRDVVLLNSDTVVTEGWLDRIAACAASDPKIATITPFSNNAEICSFPQFCVANPAPDDPERIARIMARTGRARYPDLPTAVGFCMYIRRRAIKQLGLFDADTFGRGYGEENDFSRRAATAGWRNVLCDDAYVVHVGGCSFAETGLRPGGENLERLLSKYPDYNQLVASFIQHDPLAERRQELLAAMAREGEVDPLNPDNTRPAETTPQRMEFTGERFTPDCVREIWYEHWHRYVFARGFAAGLDVLDLACGEGYGSDLLAEVAGSVLGVDISEEAIAHARQRYTGKDNLVYRVGDATAVPAEDDSFDLVVSFETIEHLEPQAEMLAEFRRVLRPGGLLIISSPDRRTYSDEAGFSNEFHVRELYRQEFLDLLTAHFPAIRLLGQKLVFQSAIWPMQAPAQDARWLCLGDGHLQEGSSSHEPLYFIALCGAAPECLPDNAQDLWLFDDQDESVYAHYNHEIRKNMQAGAILQERDQRIAELEAQIAGLEQGGAPRDAAGTTWLKRVLTRLGLI